MGTIALTKEVVRLCRRANVSSFLWGAHGLGKSTLVREIAAQLEIGFVDLRCAQLDSVDLRGFPDKGSDGRTHFLPPADLPAGGEGILFLDELNRAGSDVLAALFQLVLDRRIGEYELPAGWSITAAGNFNSGGYDVQTLDAAFVDRFCHMIVSGGQATLAEWSEWTLSKHGHSAYKVVNFCSVNQTHLEVAVDEKLDFDVQPSRRSWDAVIRGMQVAAADGYSEEVQQAFAAGLVGDALATSFMTYHPIIGPEDLFRAGMRDLRQRLRKSPREEISLFVSGVMVALKTISPGSPRLVAVIDLIEFLTKEYPDLAVALTTAALANDPKYRELENETEASQVLPLITNQRLATRVNDLAGDMGLLGEIIRRPRLRDRLGELISIE